MSEPQDPGALSDAVSLRIEATPEAVYAIVTDIAQMGRLSPECTGGQWLGRRHRARGGRPLQGQQQARPGQVVDHEHRGRGRAGRAFSFETAQSGAQWTYRMEPDGDGTLVTESRAMFKARPLLAKVFATLLLGGIEDHDDEMRDGMRQTLERLKAVAEAP